MGPAGSGKSTYCHSLQEHCAAKVAGGAPASSTLLSVANLDPAAEYFDYEPIFDIRDLISVTEVMEELGLGPNGALLYCMEYLLRNLDWLHYELDQLGDDDFLLLDCAGQLELYTHVPVQKILLEAVTSWGYTSMVGVFLIDASFCVDTEKFLSGALLSLSAMIALELPHISVLSKCDLLPEEQIEKILDYASASYMWDLEQDRQTLLQFCRDKDHQNPNEGTDSHENQQLEKTTKILFDQPQRRIRELEKRRIQRHRLTESIAQLLDDWQMVSFIPLNLRDEDSVEHVLQSVSHCIQYGEDQEVRGPDTTADPDV